MTERDDREADPKAEDGFTRMRWIPLVLEDLRDYAAERGQTEIAQEIEACSAKVNALLALAELPKTDKQQ